MWLFKKKAAKAAESVARFASGIASEIGRAEILANVPGSNVPADGVDSCVPVIGTPEEEADSVPEASSERAVKDAIKADFLTGLDRMEIHHGCKEAVRALVESVTR